MRSQAVLVLPSPLYLVYLLTLYLVYLLPSIWFNVDLSENYQK